MNYRSRRLRASPRTLVLFPLFDPLGLLEDAFRSRSLEAVEAEDLVLAWLLSLPEGLDPSVAARPALAVFASAAACPRSGNRIRLEQLLVEVTRYPRERLLAEREVRRRRRIRSA